MSPDPERERADLERLEARVADALCSADPGAALGALRSDAELAPAFCAGMACAREDGFRIAALLVARLRFERLLHGSREAETEWRADPRAFTERFRRYHAAVPPRAWTPPEEAALYEAWSGG